MFEILFQTQDDYRFDQFVECYASIFEVDSRTIYSAFEALDSLITKTKITKRFLVYYHIEMLV